MTEHFTPMAGGSKRAMVIASKWGDARATINYQMKMVDDQTLKLFPKPEIRAAMARAREETSVLETKINDMREINAEQGTLGKPMMSAAELAHAEATIREQFTASGKGVDNLPADQRAHEYQMADWTNKMWTRMEARGLVAPLSKGLPFYYARFVMQRDDQGNIVRAGGTGGGGKGINKMGGDLTTAGPGKRKYLTPEETVAAAQAALHDPDAFLLYDTRATILAMERNERAIAGSDFISAIERIGVADGSPTLFHGRVPTDVPDVRPEDYFTMADHPSFRKWTGSGWDHIYVSKEFLGPIKALLPEPGSKLYQALSKAKGKSMGAIMWAPTQHLSVELGRAFPLVRTALGTKGFWSNGSRITQDPGKMRRATESGTRPIGQFWKEDAASVADRADVNKPPPGPLGKIAEGWHNLHQKVLWDTVFKLQMGIWDHASTYFQNHGFSQIDADRAASHEANRYAGALPQEHLSRWANMASNLLLFSRSFTLGNLGIMKDALVGLPRQTRAIIEANSGGDVAKSLSNAVRRRAMGAVALDVGLSYLATTVLQQMFAIGSRTPSMGLGPAAQSVVDDWRTQAAGALSDFGKSWNPWDLRGVLPQGNNEPGKESKSFLGTKADGTAIYGRLSLGKVGEEFEGYGTRPFGLLWAKLSPMVRAGIEDVFGKDSLGRNIYNPDPKSFGDMLKNVGLAVGHVAGAQIPLDQITGAYGLAKTIAGHGDPGTSLGVQAARTIGPIAGVSISQGFPGGPKEGWDHYIKEGLAYEQQQAVGPARKLYLAGDTDGARQKLLDAHVEPKSVNGIIGRMSEEKAAAGSNRFAARRETSDQQDRRGRLNTGVPLSP